MPSVIEKAPASIKEDARHLADSVKVHKKRLHILFTKPSKLITKKTCNADSRTLRNSNEK